MISKRSILLYLAGAVLGVAFAIFVTTFEKISKRLDNIEKMIEFDRQHNDPTIRLRCQCGTVSKE